MTASKMLMNFPSRFLAVAFSSPSNCTTCCCCCCSSILEMRVWHASSASCGQEHILGHSSPQLLPHQLGQASPHTSHCLCTELLPCSGSRGSSAISHVRGEQPLADWALQPAVHHSTSSAPRRLDVDMPGWATPQLLPRSGGYPAAWSLQLCFQEATERTKVLCLARNLHPPLGCVFPEPQIPTLSLQSLVLIEPLCRKLGNLAENYVNKNNYQRLSCVLLA